MPRLTDLQKLSLDICRGKVEKYSVEDGSQVIRQAILDACGGTFDMYRFQQNKYEVYRILSETITIALAEMVVDKYKDFVEVKDVALGDTVEFYVTNNELFKVGMVADGTNQLRRQRIVGSKLAMTGFPLGVKIYTEWLDFVLGKTDWAEFIQRITKSLDYKIAEIIVKQIETAYNGLDAKFVESGTYDPQLLLNLCQLVQAKTGVVPAIYGTKKSLAFVRPEMNYIAVEDKSDIRNMGYVGMWNGVQVIEIPQTLTENDEFALADDMLLVLPAGDTKMIKMGFEGDAYVQEVSSPETRMDMQLEYLVTRKVQIGTVKGSYYGVYHSLVK